ncbi:MAG: hypothetical protein H0T51_07185 [Pirellulales bacterium]|nr:hypothetical protein [Pirellulales bacterium]
MTRLLLLGALTVSLGCGDGGTVPVTGTVKNADGSDLQFESGLVVFEPMDEGKAASGAVEPDGSFVMMTETPGDGVAPGNYKVVLNVFKNYREQELSVPETYANAATTPLTARVDADNNHFDFVVEP